MNSGSPPVHNAPDCEQVDAVLKALSHPVQRAVMRVVVERDTGINLYELESELDLSQTTADVEDDQLDTVLRHQHIPVLEKHGVVEFNNVDNTVIDTTGELTTTVLEVLDEHFEATGD